MALIMAWSTQSSPVSADYTDAQQATSHNKNMCQACQRELVARLNHDTLINLISSGSECFSTFPSKTAFHWPPKKTEIK